MSKNNIPVVFSINKEYYKQVAVVIRSILENSTSHFDFFILSIDLSDRIIKILKDVILNIDCDSTISLIDMHQFINENLDCYMSKREDYNHISKETFFRFYIPRIFSDYEKILYLDSDILVFDDLKKLFEHNIDNTYAGVIEDPWQKYNRQTKSHKIKTQPQMSFNEYLNNIIHINEKGVYFNAGVLLLNLKQMREDNIENQLWTFAQKHSPLEYQDQDVLNAVFSQRITIIHQRWNLLKDYETLHSRIKNKEFLSQLTTAIDNPAIIHFVGPNKPWNTPKNSYQYIEEWWQVFWRSGISSPEDRITYTKIINTKIKNFKSYLLCRIFSFDLLSIYREASTYYIYLFGQRIFRKTIRDAPPHL